MRIADHVVVAVDFSEPSRIALRAAVQLAKTAGTRKITILHAVRPTIVPHTAQPDLPPRLAALRDRVHDAADAQMRRMLKDELPPCGVELQVVEGAPSKVIPGVARDIGGTLLAVGTHARRGFRRWLKGSVVESMLPHLHIPALVLPMGDDQSPPQVDLQVLRHVSVALDIHDASAWVAQQAREALAPLQPKPSVTLVGVVDIETPQLAADDALVAEVATMIQRDAQTKLDVLRIDFDAAGLPTDVEVRAGDVEEEILAVARARRSELIVTGTAGRTGRFDFGSTSAEVIRHSHVSVLVFPVSRGPQVRS